MKALVLYPLINTALFVGVIFAFKTAVILGVLSLIICKFAFK